MTVFPPRFSSLPTGLSSESSTRATSIDRVHYVFRHLFSDLGLIGIFSDVTSSSSGSETPSTSDWLQATSVVGRECFSLPPSSLRAFPT